MNAMSETALWSWAALLGLGAFHGLNPGMGWLFAVALGMQERRRSADGIVAVGGFADEAPLGARAHLVADEPPPELVVVYYQDRIGHGAVCEMGVARGTNQLGTGGI